MSKNKITKKEEGMKNKDRKTKKNLNRIGTDNFSINTLSKLECEAGFTSASRTGDNDYLLFSVAFEGSRTA